MADDTTIKLIIQSVFGNKGVEDARSSITGFAQALDQLKEALGPDAFGALLASEDVEKVFQELMTGTTEVAQSAREMAAALGLQESLDPSAAFELAEAYAQEAHSLEGLARAAAQFGEVDLTKKLQNEANAARAAAQQFSNLGRITRQEILVNIGAGAKGLTQFEKNLKQAAQAQRELGKSAQESAEWLSADVHEANAAAIENVGKSFGLFKEEVKESLTPLQKLQQEFGDAFKNVRSADEAKKRLTELRNEYVALRDTALSKGSLEDALVPAGTIRRIERLDKELFGMHGAFKFLGKEATVLGNIIQSTFNQLGFAMFVTTSTLRNFQMILRGVITQINEMNKAAQKFVALSNAIAQAGMSQREFREGIESVSRGLIEQGAVVTGSIKILRQQNQEIRQLNPLFIQTSENLARLGGDITTATSNYDSLVDAIIRGEGAIIESGGAMLDLSDATILMEIRAARLNRELTDLEKQTIVLDVFRERAQKLNEEAGQLPDIGENFGKAGDRITEAWQLALASGGFFLDTMFGGLEKLQTPLANIGGSLLDLATTLDPMAQRAAQSFGQILLFLTDTRKALFQVAEGFTNVGEHITATIATAVIVLRTEISNLVDDIQDVNNAIIGIQAGNLGLVVQSIRDIGDEGERIDIAETWQEQLEIMKEASRGFLDDFRSVLGISNTSFAQAAANLARGLSDALKGAFEHANLQSAIEGLQNLLGPEAKLAKDIQDVWNDHGERMVEIENRLQEDTFKIRQDASKRREELEREHAERLNDIAADLSRKWAQINEDSADRIEDIQEDAQDRREDAAEKKADKLAEIEEDLQKKIDDILRRFELARLRALIDRDARALFEAEQRKREELAKAKETAKEKREDANEDHKKELADIDEQEAKKIQREQEAAEKRRRRAQEAAEIRRLETIAQYEEQNAQINELEEERLAEAFDRFKKEQKQLKKEREERLRDLKEAFDEKMLAIRAQALIEEAQRLQQLDATTSQFKDAHDSWLSDYDEFLGEYEGRISDTLDLINSLGNATPGSLPLPTIGGGGAGGTSGGGSGGSGGCVSGAQLTFVPTAGTTCPPNTPLNTALVACDGTTWTCWADTKTWIYGSPFTSSGAQAQGALTTSGGGTALLGGGTTFGSTSLTGGQKMQTTIVVQGDQTLEEIFKSLAYESFVEVVN